MKKFMTVLAVAALVAFAAPVFAAENPFMDVPAGHWAYDAVAQLASRGVVSGYQDGSYKGAQPTTRYEMASLVARALAQVDMEKASKQDVELLKKLVLEFKNELDALGVKVGEIDKRVAVLEDGIGGWKIRGVFRFDAKFASTDTNNTYNYNSNSKKNEFSKEQFRLFLTKTIDENTYFYAQYRTGGDGAGGSGLGDLNNTRWSHLYVDTKIFGDGGLRVGRFTVDFEDDHGFYIDDDALFGDFRTDGFRLTKSFGMLNATAIIGRNNTDAIDYGTGTNSGSIGDSMAYILDLNVQPNEKFFIGATGYWCNEDSAKTPTPANGEYDVKTYGIYAGYSFTPSIALKGIYYFQDLDKNTPTYLANNDSPKAWKAILDIKQDALKFTSLWVEYSNVDNNFAAPIYSRYSVGNTNAFILANTPRNANTSKIWFAKASQQWNDKWNTFVRFATVDFDTAGLDDATEWGLGVGYQYTPAINFELSYSQVDYGTSAYNASNNGSIIGTGTATNTPRNEKESVVRFRTTVNF